MTWPVWVERYKTRLEHVSLPVTLSLFLLSSLCDSSAAFPRVLVDNQLLNIQKSPTLLSAMQELSQDMPSSLPSPAETDRMPSPPPANLMKRKREADDEAHEQTIASEHSLSPPADSTRRRSATPPRNQNGLYTCTHPTPWPNCADMTFRMPCEYR